MSEAVILGAGSTPFGTLPDRRLLDLAAEASIAAVADAGIERRDIDAVFFGNFLSGVLAEQEVIAPMLAAELALDEVETVKFEGACASSALALRQAVQLVRADQLETVLVVGAEQMSAAPTDRFTAALGLALDGLVEGSVGLTFPGYWALVTERYLHEFGAEREQLIAVSVKNRRNGVHNEYAQFRKEVSAEEALASRAICDPLQLYDCCPAADGAAALIVTKAVSRQDRAVLVAGSAMVGGPPRAVDQSDLTTMPAASSAARRAFADARITPEDVNVAELHDCFTTAEVVETEALGFFEPGEGAAAVAAGRTDMGGDVVVNPSGGLLSKGHPVGATGCGQVFELVRQIRGEHPRQVEGAEVGLAHNAGGTGAVATVHIVRGPA